MLIHTTRSLKLRATGKGDADTIMLDAEADGLDSVRQKSDGLRRAAAPVPFLVLGVRQSAESHCASDWPMSRSSPSAAAYAIEANRSKKASAAPGFGRQKRPPNLNMGRELGRPDLESRTRSLVNPEASIFKII